MNRHRRSIQTCAPLCLALLIGCFSSEAPVERSAAGRVQVKLSPIELNLLSSDADQLARVLSMPFVEVAERLPPFAFECEAEMSFTEGSKNFRQLDRHTYREDAAQNFHAGIRSSDAKAIDVWLQGTKLLVRHGNGRVRATPRRDIEIEKWGELALSPQSHTFELFYPYLTVEDKGPEEFEGRKVRRFALSLNLDSALTKESYPLPQSETRLAPVAGWRERAKPLEVNGFILVDVETAVALQSSFRGRLSISDPQSPEKTSELTLRFESTIRENNEEISTEGLNHIVDEVSRARPKKGNLSFYELPTEPTP